MLDLDTLRIADLYAWFGCQATTAQELGCNQSTVSRRARQANRLRPRRRSWDQEDFLLLERQVYQCWRFAKGRELRVHAYRWINPVLREHLPDSWLLNPPRISATRLCPIQLLQEHVIDALLAPGPLVADLDPERFDLVPVYSAPLQLLAASGSVLACETGWSAADIAGSSVLAGLDFVPTGAAQCSRELDAALFDTGATRTEELARVAALPHRYWGMPLTPLVVPGLTAVDYPSPLPYREILVVLREWRHHLEIGRLLQTVRHRLQGQCRARPGLDALAIA